MNFFFLEFSISIRYDDLTTTVIIGVLMWEVFTCGKMPYGRLKNAEVVERVQRGIVLERPPRCPEKIYAVRLSNMNLLLSFIVDLIVEIMISFG